LDRGSGFRGEALQCFSPVLPAGPCQARHGRTTLWQLQRADRRRLLLSTSGYGVTSVPAAWELRSDARQSDGRPTSAPNQSRDLPQIGSALLDRARGSAHKWFPDHGRASVIASAISARAFPQLAE